MVSPEVIAGLKLRSIERSTKNVVMELADGRRFLILGGKNRRPLPKGVAGFTPGEMMKVLNEGVDEESFKGLITLKETFGPDTKIVGVEKPDATP